MSVITFFLLSSCVSSQKEKSEFIEYQIEFMKGDSYQPAMGIDNPFKILCDSNYYVIPFYKNEEMIKGSKDWYILRPNVKDNMLLINFYDIKTDELKHTEKVELKINKLPNPYLQLLPCDTMCNSLESIKNVKTIWPQLYYYGIDIRCRVRNCTVSIIRGDEVIVAENYEEFKIDEKFNELIKKLKIGDVLKFSNLEGVKMPDGTTRTIENKEILIEY